MRTIREQQYRTKHTGKKRIWILFLLVVLLRRYVGDIAGNKTPISGVAAGFITTTNPVKTVLP